MTQPLDWFRKRLAGGLDMDPLGRPLQVDQVPVVEMLIQQGLAVRPGHSYFEQVPWGSLRALRRIGGLKNFLSLL